MKKFALPVLFLLGSLPAWADVKPAPPVGTPISVSENLNLNTGIERVLQIRAMDKDGLGPEEREGLKQELRLIENDLLAWPPNKKLPLTERAFISRSGVSSSSF